MPERRALGLNVVANAMTSASVIGTALISVPLILGEVGIAGYGVWTLAQTVLLWTMSAEAGFGPALQRFVAVGHGARAREDVARLVWSACFAYASAGVILAAAGFLAAGPLTRVFDVSPQLSPDAVRMFEIVSIAIVPALVSAALGNVQQGLERFTALGFSAAASSGVFLVAVIGFLAAGLGLPGLALAALAQQLTILLLRAGSLRHELRSAPRLVTRAQAGEMGGFALRLQMTTLSTLVNSQTDKIVVGLVATPAVVGQLGIGTQVAEAGRILAGAVLSPIVSRLAVTHGAGDEAGLDTLFERLHRLWILLVIGGTVIGGGVLYPLIRGWLGAGHGSAAVYGAALVVAYGLSLLTGTPVAYLRAIGRPSLEARLGAVLIACNIVLTIALGIAFGAYGVVAATTVTYCIGTAWFFRNFAAAVPRDVGRLPGSLIARGVGTAVAAAAAACAWGLAMVAWLPTGVALVGVAAGAGAAAAAYVAVATGIRPTPARLRRLVLTGA